MLYNLAKAIGYYGRSTTVRNSNKAVLALLDCGNPFGDVEGRVLCQLEAAGHKASLTHFYKDSKAILESLSAGGGGIGVCSSLAFCFSPNLQAFPGEKLPCVESTFQAFPSSVPHILQIWAWLLAHCLITPVFPVLEVGNTCSSLVPPMVPR